MDIAHAINVLAGDPDYSNMNGWAAYVDAGVLQALNDGMRLYKGQNAIGSGGSHGGGAWATFFGGLDLFKNNRISEGNLIVLRLAGEQGGINYATTLSETERRYGAENFRVRVKIDLFLWGADSYRSAGMSCQAGCANPISGAGGMIEALVVAHTDPRTSGNTWLIQQLSQAPDVVAGAIDFLANAYANSNQPVWR
ncbi:MAG TPA: hypothetical protein PLD25_29965 [Chloroflexota bacterium]|nr:hypothetical protein [Chloroflexota bacterium]HUM67358.1 hypothetical protein [Chloroflexota bacterium]